MASRRDMLKGAAALLLVRNALAAGEVEKGIYRVRGNARVNGAPARQGAEIAAGDAIRTGDDGELVFVAGRDAFLVRRNASITFGTDALRVVTGALLSVFASGRARRIQTPTATIGIRGTGVYVEAEERRTYVCTCYGEAELASVDDPATRETVRTSHHEQPRYIMARGAPQMLMEAPVINHTDAELILLESLVGRQPPFMDSGRTY
jgi:hypothetical protein